MTASGYECAPDVQWVVETGSILIVRLGEGACCSLPYPAAAVWDFVSRGYRPARMARMIQHIGGFRDLEEAGEYLKECLQAWAEAGLVRRVKGGDEHV